MESEITQESSQCNVIMSGQFIFSDSQKFRRVMEMLEKGALSMTLDLGKVTFIDSAALGMLLLLRDQAGQRNAVVTLVHPQGQVKKLFAVSRFDQLFKIVE